MAKFAVKNIDAVKGRQTFKQLIIHEGADKLTSAEIEQTDGVLDAYEKELEAAYTKSFTRLVSLMSLVANLKTLSEEQMRDITPESEQVKEYEFKAGDLRIFAIKIPNGQLVILCGFKNSQKKDISQFRALKLQYLNTINITK